jgi:hypothetical protein
MNCRKSFAGLLAANDLATSGPFPYQLEKAKQVYSQRFHG